MTKQMIASLGLVAMMALGCSKATPEAVLPVQAPEVSPVDEAIALAHNMDYARVIENMTRWMEAQGASVDALTLRGVSYAKLGQTYLAFKDLNAAVSLEHSVYTLYNLGTALRMSGHCARAANAFEEALILEPTNEAVLVNLISSHTCYGNTEAASELFLKLVSNFPKNATAYTSAAILKATVGSFEEARQAAQKAIELDAFYKPGYHVLGYACQNLGDTECAKQADAEIKKLKGQRFRNKSYARKR